MSFFNAGSGPRNEAPVNISAMQQTLEVEKLRGTNFLIDNPEGMK